MRLTNAYSKIKKRNLVLINNATHQRETLSERPIRLPLRNTSIIKEFDMQEQFQNSYFSKPQIFCIFRENSIAINNLPKFKKINK